jgi:hypothetical protein
MIIRNLTNKDHIYKGTVTQPGQGVCSIAYPDVGESLQAANEAHIEELARLAKIFVEDREEATESIWYCRGEIGKELLKTLGIPYTPKE